MKYSIAEEGMHPYPENPPEAWQESCMVSWRDSASGISANLHMGCEIGHGLCSGPLTVVHDGQHLRALVDTPECMVNLIVEDLFEDRVSPVHGDDDFAEQVAKGHFNVECRVRGEVTLDGRHFAVNGPGHRDHSWGPRTFEQGRSTPTGKPCPPPCSTATATSATLFRTRTGGPDSSTGR